MNQNNNLFSTQVEVSISSQTLTRLGMFLLIVFVLFFLAKKYIGR